MLNPSKIVVTCFIQYEDKILILQRARRDSQYSLWGIPGGKLDQNETPVLGLVREVYEETKIKIKSDEIELLGTALSHTSSDGQYGLYLYHTSLKKSPRIKINLSEHLNFQWATLEEFTALPLLFAQGEAYQWVEHRLRQCMHNVIVKKSKIQGGKSEPRYIEAI